MNQGRNVVWLRRRVEGGGDFSIDLPGSKSISLRTLVLASLAKGTSHISGLADCDDVDELARALSVLGVGINALPGGVRAVHGTGGGFLGGALDVQLGLSGTSTRFLIALAFLRKEATRIDGLEPLRARPNRYLIDALRSMGARIAPPEAVGLPVLIEGCPNTAEPFVEMAGDRSSQFFSALMQVAPLLEKGLTIKVVGELVSRPYINITIAQMKAFGVDVTWNETASTFSIAPQAYRATDLVVEGDASGASYFAALATIHGTSVVLRNLGSRTLQGDYGFLTLCERLGATVTSDAHTTQITGPRGGLKPVPEEIDMADMPDVAPTLMAIAPLVPGGLRIKGLSTLRIKECDRLAVSASHLRLLNIPIEESVDAIVIGEHQQAPDKSVELDTFDDHRIAMSFAVLASKWSSIGIRDSHCVGKTFPNFWKELTRFGVAEGSPVG
jgi:3-phosphoshikimate 1-carboxyvinyltransferase